MTGKQINREEGFYPNDEKPKEQTSNLNQTYDGVPMFRNGRKKWLRLDKTNDDTPMMKNRTNK